MKSEPPAKQGVTTRIDSVEELVRAAEISQVIFHEVSARRLASGGDDGADDDVDGPPALQVAVRIDGRELEVRCRVDGEFHGGKYVADVSACYELQFEESVPSDGEVAIGQDVTDAFVSNVGIMAVYPFLRQAIHQSGSRLGLQPPLLPLLRLGSFEAVADGGEPDWAF